ncbi:MAG TPA: cytochrome P450 [Rhizobiales bacterium]|nr:cytochrome P450 [Hyphomicrobiales bacterium]
MPSVSMPAAERRSPESGRRQLDGVLGEGFSTPHAVIRQHRTQTVVLLDPKPIRHCFISNAANYRQAAARKRLMEPVLGESILTGEGDVSVRVRQQIATLFNRPALESYAAIIRAHSEDAVRGIADGVYGATALAARIALENLSLTLFSGALSGHVETLLSALDAVYDAMGGLPLVGEEGGIGYYPQIDRPARQAAGRKLREAVSEILAKRLGEAAQRGDLLDRLIGLRGEGGEATIEQMIGDVVTFLIAGHETTAATVAWALYLLSRHNGALERAAAEADRIADDGVPSSEWPDRLPFVLACVEETQRLYPPVPVITRQSVADDAIADIEIAGGSVVVVPVRLLHRLHRFWDEPERFQPERFLPGNRQRIERHSYLPFGLGPRMCIGAAFGNREAAIMLAVILRRFRPRYAGGREPVPLLKVVLRADNGIPIALERRPGR